MGGKSEKQKARLGGVGLGGGILGFFSRVARAVRSFLVAKPTRASGRV
jgi:hypothetical protein